MSTGRKRWWRTATVAVIGGGVVAGVWFGFIRATAQPTQPMIPPEAGTWTQVTVPAAPTVEMDRAPSAVAPAPTAPAQGPVVPASGTLPIPVPATGTPALSTPPTDRSPVLPPVEPIPAPRIPDPGSLQPDNKGTPSVAPAIPPAELPPLPPMPRPPETKPIVPPLPVPPSAPAPGSSSPLPPIPVTTEPPKAPMPLPAVPTVAPAVPIVPPMPAIPQPVDIAPSVPPVNPVAPTQPPLSTNPDSRLNPSNPGNTLNPTIPPDSPVIPIQPVLPGEGGLPGLGVARPKSPEPVGSSEKPVFLPGVPDLLTPRDPTMLNFKQTAAIAILGGTFFAAEQGKAFTVPPLAPVIPPIVPVAPIGGDEKMDIEKLKKDLEAANEKIKTLEKQVAALTELLKGKKDNDGIPNPAEPGAVEEIKRLKDRLATAEKELAALKTQTALRPAIPEVKGKGIVKLINEYPIEVSIVVNDKSYRVAPNTVVDVEVPAGPFTYQLLQSGAPATKSVIGDKETVRLRIK